MRRHANAAFLRSIAALYERRQVAQQYGCVASVNMYYDVAIHKEQWKMHDELLYKHGFDVPLPKFLQNENRAAFLRIAVSDLPECHRLSDAELSWYRGAAQRRQDSD